MAQAGLFKVFHLRLEGVFLVNIFPKINFMFHLYYFNCFSDGFI